MSLRFFLDGSELSAGRVRVDAQLGLTGAAESGSLGTGVIEIDDPDGTLTCTGWMTFHVLEDQCSEPRMWTGYIYDRAIARGRPEHLLSTARTFVCTIVDLNANLNFRVFYQDAAKRPYESDIDRIAWMLTQTQATDDSRINDTGFVNTSQIINFDEADYRGQYPNDLLASVAPTAGNNYYLFYDPATALPSLYYDKTNASVRTSTLRISNVDADVDESVTFSALGDVVLTTDPSSTYSGVRLGWRGGYVYSENATTETNFIARDGQASDDRIGRLATAQSVAAKWLDQFSTEQDRLTLRVRLPLDKVNLILEGQRVQVKFSHLPSYTSFTYVRVVRRTVRITQEQDPREYEVELELSNATPLPGSSGGGGFPHQGGEACPVSPTDVNASGGTVSATGTNAPVNPTRANDGDNTTETIRNSFAAFAGTYTSYWIADLGAAFACCEMKIRQQEDGVIGGTDYLGPPQTVPLPTAGEADYAQVAWSTNGTDWTDISASVTETTELRNDGDGDYTVRTYTIPLITARYFRIGIVSQSTNTEFYNGYGFGTWEINAGTAATAAAPAPGQPVNNVAPDETPDGSTADFTAPFPYADGSMRVQVQGIDVTDFAVTESDPTTGAFSLDFAPLSTETVTLYFLGR